jgi:hypothetical protein
MTPTLFGAIALAVSLIMLIRAKATTMLSMTLFLSLMGGSAALFLPGLGNSSLQPAILALFFLTLKCVLPGPGKMAQLQLATRDLTFLIVFVLYGVVGAWTLPYIFAGALNVTPLRPTPDKYIYASSPLAFSGQNITASVYLMATLLAALCGHVAASRARSEITIARTAGTIAGIHAVLGISGVVFAGTAWTSVLGFFRNGFYAQLNQSFDGFVRMNGIWPEPAVYSAFGFAWLVFVTELWLRDVERRWTGWGAFLLTLALLLSTSTTAYIGLVAFGVILTLRIVFAPGTIAAGKTLVLLAGMMLGFAGILALVTVNPDAAAALGSLVSKFTVDKASSASALQRAFWAKHGIAAFWTSSGLGIGPGSFRSSSLFTAILGSTGVIGICAVVAHLARVVKPLHASTYRTIGDARLGTGVAASWAALVMLVPAAVSAPSPDPGFIWGFFSGIALALRRTTIAARRPAVAPLDRILPVS